MVMSLTILCCLCLLILNIAILRPARRRRDQLLAEDFRHTLLLFKLQAIRAYYPELSRFSYREIAQNCDVERAYNAIGRRRRRGV